ncbi:MAG TPA: class I SAM-dependent methyltransferase [Kofleriaceae bacterium]|nr:class I SAM-dependent methyltransferase [Kofleriaceae bacterium]
MQPSATTPNVTWLAGGFCLEGVEATLLGPLRARAAEQLRPQPCLQDPQAVAILQRLGCGTKLESTPGAYHRVAQRTSIIDRWVNEFLDAQPAGVVVELGAGLNTRCERISAGRGTWIELDFPRVMRLRNHVLASLPHRRQIAASIADAAWFAEIPAVPGPICFVAEALLGYLPGPAVRWLLGELAQRFPEAVIIFDTHPDWCVVNGTGQDMALDTIVQWMPAFQLRDAVRMQATPTTERHSMLTRFVSCPDADRVVETKKRTIV